MNVRRSSVWFSCQAKVLVPGLVRRLQGILSSFGIGVHFLKGTCDVFCRDYMPVRAQSGDLVQFVFDPSYLKSKHMRRYRSDPSRVARRNGISIHTRSELVLDGGNVVQGFGRTIVTDRIFTDNPAIPRLRLVRELENLLKAEVFVIPALPGEVTGHADGLIRLIARDRVMIHARRGNDTRWHDKLTKRLRRWGFSFVEIPFVDAKSGAEGLHINYLDLPECVIVPGIGKPLDGEIMECFKPIFRHKPVFLLDARSIMQYGGAFNCMTWTA